MRVSRVREPRRALPRCGKLSGSNGTPTLLSFPRFLIVDFPPFIALAVVVVRRPILRWAVLAALTTGLVVFTVIYSNGMWVA